MFDPGQIISYWDMCAKEKANLRQGMNFRLHKTTNVILMSQRPNAPYTDRIEEGGRVLIYEGHDIAKRKGGPDPKTVDQPLNKKNGNPTPNKLFLDAAQAHSNQGEPAEIVKVYEKLRTGIWVYNGNFELVDAWVETSNNRNVFKFKLELVDLIEEIEIDNLDHNRIIPSAVKLEVWQRDEGQCVKCGSTENLHFDHIIPYSKGGSSLVTDNIQILCAKHNLRKGAKIE